MTDLAKRIQCRTCGVEFPEGFVSCPSCGGSGFIATVALGEEIAVSDGPARGSLKLNAATGRYSLSGHAIAMVIEGPDRAEISDFVGASAGTKTPAGNFALQVDGAPPRGRRNESAVTRVLGDALRLVENARPRFHEGVDSRGEDGRVELGSGLELILQIVTVPADEHFGRAASTGHAKIEFTAHEAAAMLRGAIAHKLTIPPLQRKQVLLALDGRHAAILRHDDILSALAGGEPLATLGFAQIWFVGATARSSIRLA